MEDTARFFEFCQDLEPDYSIFNDEPEKIYKSKMALNILSSTEKQIFLRYAYLGSAAKVAREMNVTPYMIRRYLNNIRQKLNAKIYGKFI